MGSKPRLSVFSTVLDMVLLLLLGWCCWCLLHVVTRVSLGYPKRKKTVLSLIRWNYPDVIQIRADVRQSCHKPRRQWCEKHSEPFSTQKIFSGMYGVVRHECHVAWLETNKSINSDWSQRGCDSSTRYGNSQPKKNVDAPIDHSKSTRPSFLA